MPGHKKDFFEQGREKSGMILWVCAPIALGNRYIGMTYVVQPKSNGGPDLVSPGNVLTLSEEVTG